MEVEEVSRLKCRIEEVLDVANDTGVQLHRMNMQLLEILKKLRLEHSSCTVIEANKITTDSSRPVLCPESGIHDQVGTWYDEQTVSDGPASNDSLELARKREQKKDTSSHLYKDNPLIRAIRKSRNEHTLSEESCSDEDSGSFKTPSSSHSDLIASSTQESSATRPTVNKTESCPPPTDDLSSHSSSLSSEESFTMVNVTPQPKQSTPLERFISEKPVPADTIDLDERQYTSAYESTKCPFCDIVFTVEHDEIYRNWHVNRHME